MNYSKFFLEKKKNYSDIEKKYSIIDKKKNYFFYYIHLLLFFLFSHSIYIKKDGIRIARMQLKDYRKTMRSMKNLQRFYLDL